MLTIDANVFASARVRTEVQHPASDQFLNRLVQAAVNILCPTLIVPEVAAAIARPTGNAALANAVVSQIEVFPYLSLIRGDAKPRSSSGRPHHSLPPAWAGCRLCRRGPRVRHDIDYLGR